MRRVLRLFDGWVIPRDGGRSDETRHAAHAFINYLYHGVIVFVGGVEGEEFFAVTDREGDEIGVAYVVFRRDFPFVLR